MEASTGRQEEGHAVCVRTLCKGRRNNLSPEGALLFVSLPKGARPLGTRIWIERTKGVGFSTRVRYLTSSRDFACKENGITTFVQNYKNTKRKHFVCF